MTAIERKHVKDLALLVKKKNIDWHAFLSRAGQSGIKAIAYYALQAARLQHGAVIPPEVMSRLRPGILRRRWLDRCLDPRLFPPYRHPGHSLARAKRRLLLALMDRPEQWLKVVLRIGSLKLKALRRRPETGDRQPVGKNSPGAER